MKPSESKMRSRLRHTISLSTPLDCRQSQTLQTSCEMKRRLFPGCASIISLIVLMSCLLTDLLRYVMIVSIPDTINHQELERNLFLKKTYGEVVNLKRKTVIARERLRNIIHCMNFNQGERLLFSDRIGKTFCKFVSIITNSIRCCTER